MGEGRYGKHIVTELLGMPELPPEQAWKARPGRGTVNGRRRTMEHMVWMDSNVIPNAFYCEAVWLWPEPEAAATAPQQAEPAGVPAHAHPFPENPLLLRNRYRASGETLLSGRVLDGR